MSDVAKRLARLSPEQRALLLRKAGKEQTPEGEKAGPVRGSWTSTQIVPQTRESNTAALSFAQERLWFLHQLEPLSVAYTIPTALRLWGQVSVPALAQSLEMVIQRHEILRTTFSEQGGKPVQVITPVYEQGTGSAPRTRSEPRTGSAQGTIPTVRIPVVDLCDYPVDRQKQLVDELTQEEISCPFDLSQGPLFRLRLLRLREQEHILLLSVHHIVFDGWSLHVFVRELTTFYEEQMGHAFAPSLQALNHRLPIQYADYADWQRQWLQGNVLQEQLDYWQQQLVGAPAVLNMPTDHPRQLAQTGAGARRGLMLPLEMLQKVKDISRQQNVTLFITLLAAFQVLLMRYSGQEDIVVGTPVANRTREELEGLIGFFVNMLPLRTDMRGNPGFLELLTRVRKVAQQGTRYQDLPFEKLVDALQVERSLSATPLFQVAFILQNVPQTELQVAGLTFQTVEFERTTTKFDLTLELRESPYGLHSLIEYNTNLFNTPTIERLLKHWMILLEGIIADPQRRLSDLPLLTEAERIQILAQGTGAALGTGWNATQEMILHRLFEQQVERIPDGIVVSFEETHLTYHQLNQHTNQLAHFLRRSGIGPDSLVGLCVERSLEMVIGLLGILKAGGAYVPLDPAYPQERLTFLLEDCRPALVLAQGTGPMASLANALGASSLQPHPRTSIIDLNEVWDALRHEPATNPLCVVLPEHLAYVIYTSGSTGRPKGAMNSHRGIWNRLCWMQQTYQLTTLDRVLQKTPFSFDVSVWEFFWPLTTGSRLIVAIPGGHRDSAYLQALIAQQQVTTLHFVPSMLRVFLAEVDLQCCGSLRQIICSGETLDASLAARFFALVGDGVQLHNLYGPTEAAIDVTFWQCLRRDSARLLSDHQDRLSDGSQVPIGHPITNTQIYLLDRNLQLVPIGVTGELYIGGVGLARGYWRRPELTAERFIANPFGGTGSAQGKVPVSGTILTAPVCEGERLYRTGDLARYRPDGTIEYLGRIDHQVKLRGYRIELGEIEAALHHHPAVDEVVVLAHEGQAGEKQLVAYVVRSKQEAETRSDLRTYLQARLPDYMVPSRFVMLDALPLSPNGKVDRRALPAPTDLSSEHRATFVEPRTPLEELLAHIWMRVLGCSQVGIHDNFFELGGHSLLATQVVSHVRQAVNRELPLRTLFEAPTIAQLSASLEELMRGASSVPVPALLPRERGIQLPLSFAQERLWFLHQWNKESAWYNVPIALRLSGALQVSALERSLATMVQRHEVLRTTFEEHLGTPFQVIAPMRPIQIPVIDLQGLTTTEHDQQMTELARAEGQRPFDLASGPLLRVCLLQLGVGQAQGKGAVRTGAVGTGQAQGTVPTVPQEHVLLFTLHHIVTDGWSMGILTREMTTLYQAEINREPHPLPELPIQYADYTLWQREFLQASVLDAHIAYWKRQLKGPLAQLKLPTDRPRPAIQTTHGARLSRLLPFELQQQLKTLSQRGEVTLFMTLLSAFNVLLYYYTGQDDLVVGTDVANRNPLETEGLIGFFVNQLVLRTNLSGNPSFLEVMKRVCKVCLEAYAHQDLPFERLVEAVNPERDLSYTPLFQTKLVLQNGPVQKSPVGSAHKLPTLTVRPVEFDPGTAKFDLLLNMSESSDGLSVRLDYRTDLFSAETMMRFLHQFECVMRQMVALPDARLDNIQKLLATADREEHSRRKQQLRHLCLQELEQVRRERDLKKPRVKRREEIS